MKFLFQIFFCFLISFSAFGQEKTDSLKSKWELGFSGGINNFQSDEMSNKKQIKIGELGGLTGFYNIGDNTKISVGFFYHNFTRKLTSIQMFKFLTIPIRLNFSFYLKKKAFLTVYNGIEVGKNIGIVTITYNGNGYRPGYAGIYVFYNLGGDINYLLNNCFILKIGGNINTNVPFEYSQKRNFKITIYESLYVGISYNFSKNKKT